MSEGNVRSLIHELMRRWASIDVVLEPANSPDAVLRFEQHSSVRLPEDFAAFFRAQGGMREGVTDEHGIRFWPLNEVRPVTEELPGADRERFAGCFVFADYSLWAHGYAIRLSSDPTNDVSIVGDDSAILVASSFTEFLAKYLYDVPSLFGSSK